MTTFWLGCVVGDGILILRCCRWRYFDSEVIHVTTYWFWSVVGDNVFTITTLEASRRFRGVVGDNVFVITTLETSRGFRGVADEGGFVLFPLWYQHSHFFMCTLYQDNSDLLLIQELYAFRRVKPKHFDITFLPPRRCSFCLEFSASWN